MSSLVQDWTLTPGYHSDVLNDSDNKLINEITLWQTIQMNGGIQRVCCAGLDWEKPETNMPGNGTRIQWIKSIQVSALTAGVDFSALSRRVPLGFDGSIASIVCAITDPAYVDGSGQLTWRIKVNEYWVPDCGQIVTQLGSLQSPFEVGFVRIKSDQTVTFFVNATNAALGVLSPTSWIRVAFIGWVYPRG